MPEGWKVKSYIDMRKPDGSRTVRSLEELSEKELGQLRAAWEKNLLLAGFDVRKPCREGSRGQ